MSLVGDRIRLERRSKNIRQNELAVMIGITPQYVNDIEYGRRVPPARTVKAVEIALDQVPGKLLELWVNDQVGQGWAVCLTPPPDPACADAEGGERG